MAKHGSVVSIVPRSASHNLNNSKHMLHASQYILWNVFQVVVSIVKSDGLIMDNVRSNAHALRTCKISIVRHPLS